MLLLKNSSWALLSYHSLILEIKYFSSVCSDYWQSDSARSCCQDYSARLASFSLWSVAKHLNIQVGDDSGLGGGEVNDKSGLLKTRYFRLGGIWSWDDKIDQVVLLLKNPSWAQLSYHSLIWEIKYCTSPACAQITGHPTALAVTVKITQRRWLAVSVGLLQGILSIQCCDDFHLGGRDVNNKSELLKTQYPHLEGLWSWGGRIDQVVLILKIPSRALLLYHSLIREIKCAQDWETAYLSYLDAFSCRSSVENSIK